MSTAMLSSQSVKEFKKLFKGSSTSNSSSNNNNTGSNNIKIPGINTNDSDDTSSDASGADHSSIGFLKTKKIAAKDDEEYVPTCSTGILQDVLNSYVPSSTSPKYSRSDNAATGEHQRHKSPPPPAPPVSGADKKKPPPKRRNSLSAAAIHKMDAKRVKHFLEESVNLVPVSPKVPSPAPATKSSSGAGNSSAAAPPPASFVEIKNDIVYLTRLQKKSSFEVNLQIPIKYYRNVMPIFNKGIRVELFVQREKSDNLWTSVSVKNVDGAKLPIAIYKILNVDENIIKNLALGMNNNIKFKESLLSQKSDKNYKVYDESGIVRVGSSDKSLYANARIELKKNITYVFNMSLNVIFARNYVNVQSEFYKCALQCRDDNNYLTCLVVTVLENHTIENGEKLMHNTLA